jgi:hypothetical protein
MKKCKNKKNSNFENRNIFVNFHTHKKFVCVGLEIFLEKL